MTCDEIRDSLSAYVDGALGPDERRDVETHLATCAECARELAGLRQTVALLQRVQPARAPVGFVDRVVAAARPRPWYRRAADAVFLPALVKLPLQATAVVLVGLLAVYLFERTPELQQAARQEMRRLEPVAPAPEPPSAVTPVPSELSPAAPAPSDPGKDRPAEAVVDKADAPAAPADRGAPASPPAAVGDQDRRDASALREAGPPVATAPSAAPAPAPAGPASTGSRGSDAQPPAEVKPSPEARSEPGAKVVTPEQPARQEAEGRLRMERGPAPPPGLAAKRSAQSTAASADVVARVAVKDRDAAERDLAELIARVGGRVAERRSEAEVTVVEALIPQPRYGEFAESLARIGSWRVEAERGDLPAQVRVILRLQ